MPDVFPMAAITENDPGLSLRSSKHAMLLIKGPSWGTSCLLSFFRQGVSRWICFCSKACFGVALVLAEHLWSLDQP